MALVQSKQSVRTRAPLKKRQKVALPEQNTRLLYFFIVAPNYKKIK